MPHSREALPLTKYLSGTRRARLLLLILPALLLAASGEAQPRRPPAGTLPVIPSRPLPSFEELLSRETPDDAEARMRWNRFWYGGDATPEYLDIKATLAAQEIERWKDRMPGKIRALSLLAGPTWSSIGPTEQITISQGSFRRQEAAGDTDSGRITAIVTHPTNAQILYVATSGGGVFKTTDADLTATADWTWTSITDGLPASSSSGNVSVGALAMSAADPETLYLGLGDPFDAEGRAFIKSIDGGMTWTASSGLGNMTRTYGVLPLDSNAVFVGGNDGLKRSIDGGASFTPVSLGGSTAGKIWSIQRFSGTDLILSRALNQGGGLGEIGSIWYSSDSGVTWTQANILATTSASVLPRRITLATSPASLSTAYGMVENLSTGAVGAGVLKTTDKGRSWSFVPAILMPGGLFRGVGFGGGTDGGQAFYNHGLAVDPGNINRLFMGANLALYRSGDGGNNWVQLTSWLGAQRVYGHADFQTTTWSKTGTRTLFIGSDGGLCIVRQPDISDGAIPQTATAMPVTSLVTFLDNHRNRGLGSYLIHAMASTTANVPEDSRHRVTLGFQDNATRVRIGSGSSLATSTIYDNRIGGDGFGTLIHPTNGNLMLGSAQYVQIFRSTTGGSSDFSSSGTGIAEAGNTTLAPFATRLYHGARSEPDTVYTFVNRKIYKSNDFGSSWNPIDLTNLIGTATMRNMAASASDPQAVAIVTNGTNWASYDGGSTWTRFGVFPGIYSASNSVSSVWFDTNNPDVLYATSVSLDVTADHIWRSANRGIDWAILDRSASGADNGFPFGIPVHLVQNDPNNSNRLYAATDFGVYSSEDAGGSWTRFGMALPLIRVTSLYVSPDGEFLRAGTYGRGAWQADNGPIVPVIHSFHPPGGPVGATVTIRGRNFAAGFAVSFHTTPASEVTFVSDSEVTARVPAESASGPISLTVADLTAVSATSFQVTAAPLNITGFSPTAGGIGRRVTISGTSFSTGVGAVRFASGTGTVLAPFIVDSDTQIQCDVPPGAVTGPLTVETGGTATTPGETANSSASFMFVGTPTIPTFTPASGAVGTEVTITGTNFVLVTAVRFNGVPSGSVTVDSATQIRATVPIGAATGRISVVAAGGTGTSAVDFTVTLPAGAPTITSVFRTATTFSSGIVGSPVTITGTNFTGTTSVTFNGTEAAFITVSATQITTTVPAGATTGPVRVTNAVATSTSGTFTVVPGPPRITSVSPSVAGPGMSVVITGSNLLGQPLSFVSGAALTASTVFGGVQIPATVATGAPAGPVTLTITNLAGTVSDSTRLTIVGAPTIDEGTSTFSGMIGSPVTFNGTNLTGTWDVLFSGVPAVLSSVTATQIQAVVPPGATSGPLTFFAPGGTISPATPFSVTP